MEQIIALAFAPLGVQQKSRFFLLRAVEVMGAVREADEPHTKEWLDRIKENIRFCQELLEGVGVGE